MVQPNAPERTALEKAGFRIASTVNRHDGQGTASITVEFDNAFLELIWPDPTVSVAPGMERAVEKFKEKMNWRTSGWCPFGIGMNRTSEAPSPLPVPISTIKPDWLPQGQVIEMLTPREDTKSPSLFVEKRVLDELARIAAAKADPESAQDFKHPNGAHRITSVRLIGPTSYHPTPGLEFIEHANVVTYQPGDAWLAKITFDNGSRGIVRDLRQALPIEVVY